MRGTAISNIVVSRSAKCQLATLVAMRTGTSGTCVPWRAESRSQPAVLRPGRMRVRVTRVRMYDPSLRTPAAHDAAQKHLATIARDGVIVPGHITVDPAPHRVTFQNTDGRRVARAVPCARALDLHENVRRTKAVDLCEDFLARSRPRSCTRNYAFESSFHNRRLAFARRPKAPSEQRSCEATL